MHALAVNRSGRCYDHLSNAGFTGFLSNDGSPKGVCRNVPFYLVLRLANPGLGREVIHSLNTGNRSGHGVTVANITLMKVHIGTTEIRGFPVDLRIEVVENSDGMPFLYQPVGEMRADKARASGYQDLHYNSSALVSLEYKRP
jgi:hypothetical protein